MAILERPSLLADSEGAIWGPLDFSIAGKPALVIFETANANATGPGLANILSSAGPIAGSPVTVFHIQPGEVTKGPRPEYPSISYHPLGDTNGDIYRTYGLAKDHFMRSSDSALVTIVLNPNCRIAGIFATNSGEDPNSEIVACINTIATTRAWTGTGKMESAFC